MSVKVDSSGRRSVEVSVEVPGSPEVVWKAIATGPGISSWFVPTSFEEDENGVPRRLHLHFGEGMDSEAEVKSWDPPHSFSAESGDWGPDAPPVATEWIVEAKSGGTCVVRVVHSLFAETDDWDNQLEGTESGWPQFFRILRLYLTHYPSQPSSAFQVMGMAEEPASEAWKSLTKRLGIRESGSGRQASSDGAPPLEGRVEHRGDLELLLRLDSPAPGVAHLFALPMGGKVFLSVRLYLYGESASAAASENETLWTSWMGKHFPAGG